VNVSCRTVAQAILAARTFACVDPIRRHAQPGERRGATSSGWPIACLSSSTSAIFKAGSPWRCRQ